MQTQLPETPNGSSTEAENTQAIREPQQRPEQQRPEQQRPEQRRPEQQPNPWSMNGQAPATPQGYQQAPNQHYQPPSRPPQAPANGAPPLANHPPTVDPQHLPREKSEIGTDGTVRRVPFQEDRVAQMYQAPPDLPSSGPVYTWAPPPAQQQVQNQWQQAPPAQVAQPVQSVNDLSLLRRAKRAPRSGWRLAVHKASGGSINPGESNADVAHRELADRVNKPVRGDYRIAILSLKGGVGKTTTTIGLGSTFSSLRGDRVIAIDANPDLGTLGHRVPKQTRSTVRDLLDDPSIHRYSDVRAHTSQAPSRLEVLASEQDPAVSEAFSEADYRSAIEILQAYYNIILTDCGTGLMHSAMTGVLDMASSLVLVTSPAIDGARSASATLDWLEHHGYGKLVERTVVVVNASRKGASSIDIDQLRKLFLDRTRAVQVVPYDDHLAEGAEIDLELVSKPTRRAFLELAAIVADEFGP
ncbi:AAA family ATPase [Antrihabitans sp. YC2-6]|nr:AAA family ATPase [Antrihabitans sp. YC2-6]